jgi:hypothetical protein
MVSIMYRVYWYLFDWMKIYLMGIISYSFLNSRVMWFFVSSSIYLNKKAELSKRLSFGIPTVSFKNHVLLPLCKERMDMSGNSFYLCDENLVWN